MNSCVCELVVLRIKCENANSRISSCYFFRILVNLSMKVNSFFISRIFSNLFYNIHSRIFLVNECAGRKMALAFAQSCIEWQEVGNTFAQESERKETSIYRMKVVHPLNFHQSLDRWSFSFFDIEEQICPLGPLESIT